MSGKKSFSLALIQTAWPLEVIAVLLFSMGIVTFSPETAAIWLDAMGPISILIAAQGGAASLGPAVKDWTESKRQQGTMQ